MYPLPDPVLTLSDVAQHWAPELPGMSERELLDRLLSAFWQGELRATLTQDPTRRFADDRLLLFDVLAKSVDHPGILFTPQDVEAEPAVVELPDGGVVVDMRIRVVWPPSAIGAHPAAQHAAFAALAGAGFDQYADVSLPGLYALQIDQETFRAFCIERGSPLPQFWFARRTTRTSAGAESRCRRWLQGMAQRRGKPGTKTELRSEAMRMFTGLSARAFDRVWDGDVPPDWRQSGRPRR